MSIIFDIKQVGTSWQTTKELEFSEDKNAFQLFFSKMLSYVNLNFTSPSRKNEKLISEWQFMASKNLDYLWILTEESIMVREKDDFYNSKGFDISLDYQDNIDLCRLVCSNNGSFGLFYSYDGSLSVISREKQEIVREIDIHGVCKNVGVTCLSISNREEIYCLIGDTIVHIDRNDVMYVLELDELKISHVIWFSIDELMISLFCQYGDEQTEVKRVKHKIEDVKTRKLVSGEINGVLNRDISVCRVESDPHGQYLAILNHKHDISVYDVMGKVVYSAEGVSDFNLLNDQQLLLSLSSEIQVIDVKSKINLLKDPVTQNGTSILTSCENGAFLSLECEIVGEEDVYDVNIFIAMLKIFRSLFVGSSKRIDFTLLYKLVYFAHQKPLDVVIRKILSGDEKSGWDIAKSCQIDPDDVFMYLWMLNQMEENISKTLMNVKEKKIVIEQCLLIRDDVKLMKSLVILGLKFEPSNDLLNLREKKLEQLEQILLTNSEDIHVFLKDSSLVFAKKLALEKKFHYLERLLIVDMSLVKDLQIVLDCIPLTVNPLQFENILPSDKKYRDWYISRAFLYDDELGLIDHAQTIIKIAVRRGFDGFGDMERDIASVRYLVFEDEQEVNLRAFVKLSSLEKVSMLLHLDDSILKIHFDRVRSHFHDDKQIGKQSLVYSVLKKVSNRSLGEMVKLLKNILQDRSLETSFVGDFILEILADSQSHQNVEILELIDMIPSNSALDDDQIEEINQLKIDLKTCALLHECGHMVYRDNLAALKYNKKKSHGLLVRIIENCSKQNFAKVKNNLKLLCKNSVFEMEDLGLELVRSMLNHNDFGSIPGIMKDIRSETSVIDRLYLEHVVLHLNSANDVKNLILVEEIIKLHDSLGNEESDEWIGEKLLLEIGLLVYSFNVHPSVREMRSMDSGAIIQYLIDNNVDVLDQFYEIELLSSLMGFIGSNDLILQKAYDTENLDFLVKHAVRMLGKDIGISSWIKRIIDITRVSDAEKVQIIGKSLEFASPELLIHLSDSLQRFAKNTTTPYVQDRKTLNISIHPYFSNWDGVTNRKIVFPSKTYIQQITEDNFALYDVQVLLCCLDRPEEFIDNLLKTKDPETRYSCAFLGSVYFSILSLVSKDIIFHNLSPKSVVSEALKNETQFSSKLKKYYDLISVSGDSNQLKQYIPRIDIEKFHQNGDYSSEMIRKLAKTTDEKRFAFALEVNNEKVPTSILYQFHLIALLESTTSLGNQSKCKEIIELHLLHEKSTINVLIPYLKSKYSETIALISIIDPTLGNFDILEKFDLDFPSLMLETSLEKIIHIIHRFLNWNTLDTFVSALGSRPIDPRVTISVLVKYLLSCVIKGESEFKKQFESLDSHSGLLSSSSDVIDLARMIVHSSIKSITSKISLIECLNAKKMIDLAENDSIEILDTLFRLRFAAGCLKSDTLENGAILWENVIEGRFTVEEALLNSVILFHEGEAIQEVIEQCKREFKIVYQETRPVPSLFESEIEVLFVEAYKLLFCWVDSVKTSVDEVTTLDSDFEIVEWPPVGLNILKHLDFCMQSIDFLDTSPSDTPRQQIKHYLADQSHPLLARANVLRIAQKHMKIDDSLAQTVLVSQKLKENWDVKFHAHLIDKSKDEWRLDLAELLESSERDVQFSIIVEFLQSTNDPEICEKLLKKLMFLRRWSLIPGIFRSIGQYIDNASLETEIYDILKKENESGAQIVGLSSKYIKKVVFEDFLLNKTILTEEVLILFIQNDFVSALSKNESFTTQIMDPKHCLLGSDVGEVESQLVCDLIISGSLDVALDYVANRIYCVPLVFQTPPDKLLILKDYLKKQSDLLDDDTERIRFCKSLCQKALAKISQ